MIRRNFLSLLSTVPLLGWLKPEAAEPVIACDLAAGPSEVAWGLSDGSGFIELCSPIVDIIQFGEDLIVYCEDGTWWIDSKHNAVKIAHRMIFIPELDFPDQPDPAALHDVINRMADRYNLPGLRDAIA